MLLEDVMTRTWIGAAAAAGLVTVAATGFAVGQEKQPGQGGPAAQQTEKGQTQRGEAQGRAQTEKGAQGMQTQSPQAQSTMGQERMGQQRTGQERMNKAQTERPKANAEGAPQTGQANQPAQGGERMNKAQTERPKTNAEGAPQTGQVNQPAQGAAPTQRNEQATGTQTQKGGATAQSQQSGTPNASAEQAQGAERTTHVNPQQVHVTGSTHITNERAAQISDTLLSTTTRTNVNVNVNVGSPLPGEVNLMPLPTNIVELVPEFRGYDYVVANDEIVIVQPSTRKVVEVINTGGGMAMGAGGAQAMAGTRVNPCGP
jgi:hypothetical protein